MGAGAPNGNRYQIATAQYFQQWNQIGGWCAGVKVGKVDYQRVMVKKFWGFTSLAKTFQSFVLTSNVTSGNWALLISNEVWGGPEEGPASETGMSGIKTDNQSKKPAELGCSLF